MPAPNSCPAGTYNPHTGMDDLEEDCLVSPEGYYTVEASTNMTGVCDPGYYCPAGSTGPQQVISCGKDGWPSIVPVFVVVFRCAQRMGSSVVGRLGALVWSFLFRESRSTGGETCSLRSMRVEQGG